MKYIFGDMICIEWNDSQEINGWTTLENCDSSLAKCKSIGFLVKLDKEKVILATTLSSNQFATRLIIPRKNISKISLLKC